jgi:hypothetical protein
VRVGIAPRALPGPFGELPARAAVSRDSQQLLLAWNVGNVQAQLFSRDLEPSSAQVVLGGAHPEDSSGNYLSRIEVSAHGADGYALAWVLTPPYDPATNGPARAFQVRFQRLSSALQPQGEVAGLNGELAYITDFKLLGADSDAQLFAAWQVSYPYVPPAPGAPQPPSIPPTLRYVRPFAAGSPASEPLAVVYGRVHAGRDAEGSVVLTLLRSGRTPALRRIDAAGAETDRDLVLPMGSAVQSIALVPTPEQDLWTLNVVGYDSRAYLLSLCP